MWKLVIPLFCEGHYIMTPTQTMHYQGQIPQHYHRFASSLIPNMGGIDNDPCFFGCLIAEQSDSDGVAVSKRVARTFSPSSTRPILNAFSRESREKRIERQVKKTSHSN